MRPRTTAERKSDPKKQSDPRRGRPHVQIARNYEHAADPPTVQAENALNPPRGRFARRSPRPPMIIPNQHRHLTGALSAFAVRMAASASLPVEQLRLTPLRRQPGPPKPMPRQNRPAPALSRQFLRAMSTQVARDQRLTPGARVLAGL